MKLILVRHGESTYNKEEKFTGWTNVGLTEKGISQAKEAGKILKKNNYTFDLAYTSVLKRAYESLDYILDELDLKDIEIKRSWMLNERHYGALQGFTHQEAEAKYGKDKVHEFRRSSNTTPPLLTKKDSRYPGNQKLYKDVDEKDLPFGESLNDTIKRVIKYWNSDIAPSLKTDRKVIIVSHGNTIRALIKYLDNISDEDIVSLEIPLAVPICYELDENLKPIKHYYLN